MVGGSLAGVSGEAGMSKFALLKERKDGWTKTAMKGKEKLRRARGVKARRASTWPGDARGVQTKAPPINGCSSSSCHLSPRSDKCLSLSKGPRATAHKAPRPPAARRGGADTIEGVRCSETIRCFANSPLTEDLDFFSFYSLSSF